MCIRDRPETEQRYVTDWLWRAHTEDITASWFARPDKFAQGIATLGGGDVAVQAGRDVTHLRAAAAGSGFKLTPAFQPEGIANAEQFGGGALRVDAGQDVVSGQFFAAQRSLSVKAAGELRADAGLDPLLAPHALQLVYQDAAVRLQSGRDMNVASVRNLSYAYATTQNSLGQSLVLPGQDVQSSLLMQSAGGSIRYAGVAQRKPGDIDDLSKIVPTDLRAYAPNGALTMASLTQWSAASDPASARSSLAAKGQVQLDDFKVMAMGSGEPNLGGERLDLLQQVADAALKVRDAQGQQQLDRSKREPVQVVSASGDVLLQGRLSSARPVDIQAGRDVRFDVGGVVSVQHQSGAGAEVTRIKAGRDVAFQENGAGAGIQVAGPGELLVLAGRDVNLGGSAGIVASGNLANSVLLPAQGSNLTVVAGLREDGSDYLAATQQGFHVLGASGLTGKLGQAFALLGGKSATAAEFDRMSAAAQLQALKPLMSAAKLDAVLSSYVRGLPARADAAEQRLRQALLLGKPINDPAVDEALKGRASKVEPAWSALSPAQALAAYETLSSSQQAQAVTRVLLAQLGQLPASQREAKLSALASAEQLGALAAYVSTQTGKAVGADQALSGFSALPQERQMPWLNRMLMGELRSAGRAASILDADERWARYGSAYLAVDLLFPQDRPSSQIVMSSSQIKTMQKADITVINPGGGAVAGDLVAKSEKAGGKRPSDLGLVTVSGGDINTVVQGSFEVNSSRVFTLEKGNVLMWSSAGNLDAGRGAKTVSGAPAPVLRLDSEGRLVFDTSGSFSGSGIAVLSAGSDLDLYAPTGEINAGEAGIRSKGNAFLGAERLVNANDIQVSGARSGAAPEPVAAVPIALPVSEALTSAATGVSAGDKDDDERKRRNRRRNLLLEFLGFGNG